MKRVITTFYKLNHMEIKSFENVRSADILNRTVFSDKLVDKSECKSEIEALIIDGLNEIWNNGKNSVVLPDICDELEKKLDSIRDTTSGNIKTIKEEATAEEENDFDKVYSTDLAELLKNIAELEKRRSAIARDISLHYAQKRNAGIFNMDKKNVIQKKISNLEKEYYNVSTEMTKINRRIFSYRSEFNPGDILKLGRYNNKELEWIILKKESDKILVLCKECIAELPYHNEESEISWESSKLNLWIKKKFTGTAFEKDEKQYIVSAPTLLSLYEVEYLITDKEIRAVGALGSIWWLRTNDPSERKAKVVQYDGTITDRRIIKTGGVRPAMYITRSD